MKWKWMKMRKSCTIMKKSRNRDANCKHHNENCKITTKIIKNHRQAGNIMKYHEIATKIAKSLRKSRQITKSWGKLQNHYENCKNNKKITKQLRKWSKMANAERKLQNCSGNWKTITKIIKLSWKLQNPHEKTIWYNMIWYNMI